MRSSRGLIPWGRCFEADRVARRRSEDDARDVELRTLGAGQHPAVPVRRLHDDRLLRDRPDALDRHTRGPQDVTPQYDEGEQRPLAPKIQVWRAMQAQHRPLNAEPRQRHQRNLDREDLRQESNLGRRSAGHHGASAKARTRHEHGELAVWFDVQADVGYKKFHVTPLAPPFRTGHASCRRVSRHFVNRSLRARARLEPAAPASSRRFPSRRVRGQPRRTRARLL